MKEPKTLGERLCYTRTRAGMTQRQLAKLIGVRQPSISQIENGSTKETVNSAAIAAILNVRALSVNTDWIRENLGGRKNIEGICVVTGYGDSMEPLFRSGESGLFLCLSQIFFKKYKQTYLHSYFFAYNDAYSLIGKLTQERDMTTDIKYPALTIAGLILFASTVDWLADTFFRLLGV